MYNFKVYIIKALKRLKLIKYFNFHLNKTINNQKVKIPFINEMGISNFVIESDWLDFLINKFINNDDNTFVDVGANIGQTTIRVKTLRPDIKYIGFEQNSTCISYIKQLIKANNFQNCTIFNCALSSSTKFQVLGKTLKDDLRASIVSLLRPGFFEDEEYVFSINYDSLHHNERISFIKIDVEGAELEVITGMKLSIMKYQPIIVCEVLDSHHPSEYEFAQSRATELTKLILSMEYSMIRLKTSREIHKVISFQKIDTIQINQWTPKSMELNDYLFYPTRMGYKIDELLL